MESAAAASDARLEALLLRERLRAVLGERRSLAAQLHAAQHGIAVLHAELRDRRLDYESSMATMEAQHVAAARAAGEAAATLRADNQRLSAQVQLLQCHLVSTQACTAPEPAQPAAAAAAAPHRHEAGGHAGGGAASHLEMAAVWREAEAARRARSQAEESRDALQAQADMLRQQVAALAGRLDALTQPSAA